MPGTHLEDASDWKRNKILGTKRLIEDSPDYLGSVLGWATRQVAVGQPLERDLRRLDSTLESAQVQDLLGIARKGETAHARRRVADRPASSASIDRSETRRLDKESLEGVAGELGLAPSVAKRLLAGVVRAIRANWSVPTIDDQVLATVVEALAEEPAARARRFAQVATSLDAARTQVDELEDRLASQSTRGQRRFDELDLEFAAELEASRKKDSEITRLRRELERNGLGGVAWDDSTPEPTAEPPDSFVEFEARVAEFQYLDFTAEAEPLADLDSTSPSLARIAQVWDGLAALNDYARSKVDGAFSGSLKDYLRSVPAGYRGVAESKYAPKESDFVHNTKKARESRCFPVPKHVSDSGSEFMEAHLKFGNATTDPRLYFLDATSQWQRVIVGYVGRHLPVKSSN